MKSPVATKPDHHNALIHSMLALTTELARCSPQLRELVRMAVTGCDSAPRRCPHMETSLARLRLNEAAARASAFTWDSRVSIGHGESRGSIVSPAPDTTSFLVMVDGEAAPRLIPTVMLRPAKA
jgi:hypothetical protein